MNTKKRLKRKDRGERKEMDNYVYNGVFKYIFNNVDIKTKKHMIKYIFEFLLPDTVDKLIGKSVEVTKDIYTGQTIIVDHHNEYEFVKWFFEQPSDDWNLIIDKFFEDIPDNSYGSLVTDTLCYYTSDKDTIDKMVSEIKSLSNKLVEEEIKMMRNDTNTFLKNYYKNNQ